MLPETITTARLELRPLRFEDVDDALAYANDEEWSRHLLGVPYPYQRSDAIAFLARQALADRAVHPAWALVHDGRMIGGINIRFYHGHAVADMGWSVARRLWGRGLATEAARVVVDQAFGAISGLMRVGAVADSRNLASVRVMEKIGMRKEGMRRKCRLSRGELIDEVSYALLREEWSVSRAASAPP